MSWRYEKGEGIEVMGVTLLTLPLCLAAREKLTFTGEPTMCRVVWLTLSICALILS